MGLFKRKWKVGDVVKFGKCQQDTSAKYTPIEWIVLDIINNGKDIPEDECDKIFERFYRSDKSRNRENNRYGLGLAIAKNIINNHDGSIIAFSKDNYTTFRVTFKQKEH